MDTAATVTAGGCRIHYHEAGSGPPVVLLHGGIIDAAQVSWPPVAGRLADDYRVIAPDLMGYGESELADGPYSLSRHADVMAAFLDTLDIGPVTLVGVSLGGGVAIQLALDRPALVATLVPIDAFGLGQALPNGLLSYALARFQLPNRLSLAVLRRSRRLTRVSLGSIVHDLDALDPAAVDAVFRELHRPTAGEAFRRFRSVGVTRAGYRTVFTDRFGDLSVPTYLLHGAHDGLFPVAWARRASERIPDAELRVLDDCAHWAPREKPEAVASWVRAAITDE